MNSLPLGKSTSAAEVTNASPDGFWLLLGDEELFVPFSGFPWFRDATIARICDVQRPSPHHPYWPQLDIDLAVESIHNPSKFPLVSRAPSSSCNWPRVASRPAVTNLKRFLRRLLFSRELHYIGCRRSLKTIPSGKLGLKH